jgi:two-component system, chemotaxis family, sensor kinase CheA
LVQFISNSIAHGIEEGKERKEKKKSPTGVIQISTFKNDREFGIILRDDGRGLQLKKLKERAKALGKWDEKEVDSWSENEIIDSIFVSGISTSEEVTMVSGRGVGLDMVKNKLDTQNGTVTIDFKENEYCQFVVKFPIEK